MAHEARPWSSRLVLCVVSGRAPRSRFFEAMLSELEARHGAAVRQWDTSNVGLGRNACFARALAERPERDLFLWLDDDNWCPPDAVDLFVSRALEHFGAELPAVVGGIYAPTRANCQGLAQRPAWREFSGDLPLYRDGGYYPADWCAGGALLHSRYLLELYEQRNTHRDDWPRYGARALPAPALWQNFVGRTFRQFEPREHGEDVGFCLTAQRVGVPVWLDSRWVLAHDWGHTFLPSDAWSEPWELPSVPRPRHEPEPAPVAEGAVRGSQLPQHAGAR